MFDIDNIINQFTTMTKKALNSRQRSQSYTPTPLSPGDIREIPTSPLSPLRDRPLPPRLSKSLPGTPLNNSYQTSILSPTSPTISEVSEYSYENDSEAEEVFYTTIINAYEKDQIEHKKEISDLNQKILRQEEQLAQLQREGEIKDNKLQATTKKLHQSVQVNKTLQKENEQVHLELKLTSSDYLAETEKNKHLTECLNKEVANSKSLIAKLEKQ